MKQNLPRCILSAFFLALSFFAYSQTGGVSINNSNAPAHPSAILDVSSTSAPYMGMLIPRMTTANRNTIISPATGLQIFNTDCGINEYYTGNCWISMSQVLKMPDHISCSGTTDFCAGETRTFAIPAVTGATSYDWGVPAGATISPGQGTTSTTVVFGNNSGQVCVSAINICESSSLKCVDIHINPVPFTPGNITGPTSPAPGSIASYFIAAVQGANLYNWSVPAGATITSGVGTTAITVNFSCSAVSGNVSVTAQNNCGFSSASSLAITIVSLLANAGSPISSPGTLGGSPTASGGTSPYTYAWVPSTALSSTTVANPTTTVCASTTYTVTVTDANGCSATSSVTATVAPVPATPGPISGDNNPLCNSTGNIYSISPVAYATTYTWTVPVGTTITGGQGTTSITVSFGNPGNITVTAGNNCGTSSASSLAITLSGGGGSGSQTFSYTGGAQAFTVPTCVTTLTIEAWGASGGGTSTGGSAQAGRGGYSKGTLAVSTGEVFSIYVGGQGQYQGNSGPNPVALGGWNGGGNSGACQATAQPAGAGGGTDVRYGGTALTERIIIAGGGGGCYANYDASRTGGSGGGLSGGDCPAGSSSCGGGSQTAGGLGGWQNGSLGQGGNDDAGSHTCGGGGGGGYYGGGANQHSAGGGGSGYISGHSGCVPATHSSGKVFTNTSMQQGIRHGNGQVIITW